MNISMSKFFLLAFFISILAGCSRGPDESDLMSDIETRLSERFEAGLFKVTGFDRRGHQPYTQGQNDGIIVYYKAQLVFNQDYQMSGWDGRGAGSLVTLLGATPAGVIGINPDGNKQGDELLVYGFLTYKEQSGQWVAAQYLADNQVASSEAAGSFLAEDDVAENRYFGADNSWQKRLPKEINNTIGALEKLDDNTGLNLLKTDIESLLTRSKARIAKDQGRSTLISGPVSGTYFAIGNGLEKAFSKEKEEIDVIASSGAIENLNLVRQGLADFAFTQNDLAVMSLQGTGPYTGRTNKNLRALASLYPEALQIIANRSSGIETIADLAGKRVDIGAIGSGGHLNAMQLLEAYQVDHSDFSNLDMETAATAFIEGKLDAMLLTIGYPSTVIESLGEDAKLVGIGDTDIVNALTESHGLLNLTIPAGTYNGQTTDIQTLGVTALLVTHVDIDDEQASQMLTTLYGNVAELAKSNVQANDIDPASATRGVTIPLHPVAEQFSSKLN